MYDPFLSKAKKYGTSASDLDFIAQNYGNTYEVQGRADISSATAASRFVHVLIDGWACKYRLMSDGRRQIIAFLLSGDICDLDRLMDANACVAVIALTDCKIVTLNVDVLNEARKTRPAIGELLWMLLSREHAAMTEQIVALGRRTSRQRIAFLICDLFERLQALGLADNGSFRSPLTQSDIADALGLSTVHVNRTLQGLREDGLIEMRGRSLRVPRHAALGRAANYERNPEAVGPTHEASAFSAR